MPKEIYLDSRKRNEPFGNSYVLYLQNPLKNVEKVELVAATVPNTMYNITNGSNIFSVSGSNCSVSNGFYSSASLVNSVNDSLKLLSSTVKLTFLNEEGKFMFYDTSTFSITTYSNEFVNITGFTSGSSQVASSNIGVYSQTYTGQNILKSNVVANFKILGEYVHLDIVELRRPFSIDAISNVYKSQSSTTFAIIPMDVSSGCIKTFKENSDYKIQIEYPKPIDQIDRLTVNWRDFYGNLLNFNGVDENSILLRFYEAPVFSLPIVPVEPAVSKVASNPDKKTVFIMLIFSLFFILFLKHR